MGDNYVMRLLLTNDRSSARSRLALALVLAAALHMLLIANLNVSSQEPRQRLQALNLQLLAPRVDVPVPAAEPSDTITDAAPVEAGTPAPTARTAVSSQPVVATQLTPQANPVVTDSVQDNTGFKRQLSDLVGEIASFDANPTERDTSFQGSPRIRRIDSTTARRTADTYYLQSWARKIESIGKLNYPDEARQRNLRGDLSLLVTIRPDGSLKEAKILRSSGHQILDDAALRIVRLAAPYPPFPLEMRRSTDLLEIVRSWQFQRSS